MDEQQQKIQSNSPVPLYKQLEQIILKQLQDMAPGDMLPPERELQEAYDVSRATVRATLKEIERQGRIERIRGVGTVVKHPKIQPEIMKLTSFSEDIRARGMVPGSQTLKVAIVIPEGKILAALKLPPETQLLYVKRLRLANGEPVGIHELYIPPEIEISLNELKEVSSYYDLLRERHNIEPRHAVERLTAKNADSSEARLLATEVGSALLTIERVTFTETERPVEFVSLVYRADRYEYQVALFRE